MQNMFIDTLVSNLQIHSNTQDVGFWLQTPINGLESPEYRLNVYDKAGEDGGIVSSQFYGSRTITLQGIIKATNPTTYELRRTALASACAIQKDGNGYPVAKRITFTTLAGTTYYFDGFFNKPVFAQENINAGHFMLSFIVPSPFIYGTTTITSGAITRATGGGFILPVILPIVSSGATGGTVTVVNNGNAITYPVITLVGPLTNPYIYSSAIGKLMQLNYTIPYGSTVTIDMANKVILLNGSSSLLSAKTPDSEWFGLIPGNNPFSFSTGSTGDTGTMSITANPAYLGV